MNIYKQSSTVFLEANDNNFITLYIMINYSKCCIDVYMLAVIFCMHEQLHMLTFRVYVVGFAVNCFSLLFNLCLIYIFSLYTSFSPSVAMAISMSIHDYA